MNHITKTLKLTTLLGALAFGGAVSSHASSIVLNDSWGNIGGEYTATGDAALTSIANTNYSSLARVGSGFQTFCLEKNVAISGNTSYSYSISETTKSVVDPLSIGTAFLYAEFASGNLAGYNYGTGRDTSADLLQDAIWWLEDDSSSYITDNLFVKAVIAKFGSEVAAKADNNYAYSVAVLNITDSDNNDMQDQLVRVPDGGLTLALVGFAILGFSFFRRKIAA